MTSVNGHQSVSNGPKLLSDNNKQHLDAYFQSSHPKQNKKAENNILIVSSPTLENNENDSVLLTPSIVKTNPLSSLSEFEATPPVSMSASPQILEIRAQKSSKRGIKRRISFLPTANVVLIPTANEYHRAGLGREIWWDESDYKDFKATAVQEMKDFISLNPGSNGKEAAKLYYEDLMRDHGEEGSSASVTCGSSSSTSDIERNTQTFSGEYKTSQDKTTSSLPISDQTNKVFASTLSNTAANRRGRVTPELSPHINSVIPRVDSLHSYQHHSNSGDDNLRASNCSMVDTDTLRTSEINLDSYSAEDLYGDYSPAFDLAPRTSSVSDKPDENDADKSSTSIPFILNALAFAFFAFAQIKSS